MLTLTEVKDISGEAGDFQVTLTQHPRYVDVDKCIACGACAEKCPKKIPNSYDCGLGNRKAIYVKYAQAVPLKYAIDPEYCIKLTKGKCGNCEKVCPAGAIRYDDKEKIISLKVGAVILADGSETYDPTNHDTYGYRENPNIVTSLEFERILSAAGPYSGHMVRPSDRKEPEKIAWLQCIGSRDVHLGARGYCSSVCCTYAVKEAMLAKEHAHKGLDAAVFYMDIRTHGKDFERYYNRAKNELGVRFIKSRVTRILPEPDTGRNIIRYVDEGGRRIEEAFDMVVLSVGLGATAHGKELAERLGVDLDTYGYPLTSSFSPVQTSRPGIFVCGARQAPKDIPSSVVDSSAAAGVVGSRLAEIRWSQTKTQPVQESRDIRGEQVRIGVFVCRCGTNIGGIVDVPAVVEYARSLPGVAYAEENMFSCSQDTQ
ncbi:MAG: heterodisulfide reductase, partial [Desulfobacteraceae bacterium]